MSSVKVIVNGQTNNVTGVGFKRRPLYAPLEVWDLRIANSLYLQLSSPISDGQSVQVVNDGSLWPTNMAFAAVADPLRYSPAIHVNQEGYMPTYPKKAIIGYFLGDMGEMAIPTNGYSVVNAQSGATVYQGTLTLRPDKGYNYTRRRRISNKRIPRPRALTGKGTTRVAISDERDRPPRLGWRVSRTGIGWSELYVHAGASRRALLGRSRSAMAGRSPRICRQFGNRDHQCGTTIERSAKIGWRGILLPVGHRATGNVSHPSVHKSGGLGAGRHECFSGQRCGADRRSAGQAVFAALLPHVEGSLKLRFAAAARLATLAFL